MIRAVFSFTVEICSTQTRNKDGARGYGMVQPLLERRYMGSKSDYDKQLFQRSANWRINFISHWSWKNVFPESIGVLVMLVFVSCKM